jgi:hypothetical protein
MVDVLDRWWLGNKEQFPLVKTLVINQDNGPENKSRRTQFLKRMVEFARRWRLLVRLCYYPPYHSKYNPIEHCWGVLESHWGGDLLDSREAVLGFARSMLWNGNHPKVELLTSVYPTGIRLPKKEMLQVEQEVKRLPDLDDWFVDIPGHELPPLG